MAAYHSSVLSSLELTQDQDAEVSTEIVHVPNLRAIGITIQTSGIDAVTNLNNGSFKVEGKISAGQVIDGCKTIVDSDWMDIGVDGDLSLNNANKKIPIAIQYFPYTHLRVTFTGGSASAGGTAKIFISQKDY